MNREWNDSQPIYRQLRDRGAHMILDGVLKEGDPLPSVRTVAAEFRVNPLTVLKAYQELVDEELVEMKRGLGMFVKAGARDLLLKGERQKFLAEEWPRVAEKIQRLGLTQKELDAAAAKRPSGRGKRLPGENYYPHSRLRSEPDWRFRLSLKFAWRQRRSVIASLGQRPRTYGTKSHQR